MQCADGYWNQWFSLTVVIFSVLSQTVASEVLPVQQMWHRHVRMCGLVFSQTVASEASPVQQMWHRHVWMCGLVFSQTVASEASPVQQMWHRHVRMCGLVFRMVRGMRGEVTGATSWSVLLFPWASRARRSRSSRKATTFTRRWSRCCLLHQSISRTSSLSSSNGFWYTNSLVLDLPIVPVTPVHFMYLISLQF